MNLRHERLARHRLLPRQAAPELLLDLVFLGSELHLFLALVGAEKHELTRRLLRAGAIGLKKKSPSSLPSFR